MASNREVFKHLADKVTLLGMSRSELIAEVERLQAENAKLASELGYCANEARDARRLQAENATLREEIERLRKIEDMYRWMRAGKHD